MKIIFKEKLFSIDKGKEINIYPNEVNFWVGSNGSGKTLASSVLLTHLMKQESLRDSNYWMATLANEKEKGTEILGFECINKVILSSSKLRSSQFVDLNITLSLGVGRLNASEGENCREDLIEALKEKDNPNALFIFDEMDGHFDLPTKRLFFERIGKILKGTIILISHDVWYSASQERLFYFDEWKEMSGMEYFKKAMGQG